MKSHLLYYMLHYWELKRRNPDRGPGRPNTRFSNRCLGTGLSYFGLLCASPVKPERTLVFGCVVDELDFDNPMRIARIDLFNQLIARLRALHRDT